MVKKYCRAYHLRDLRQFSGWTEKQGTGESSLSDDDVVYLWDDLTVVRSPIVPDSGLIFNTVTPAWQDFCMSTLHFEFPEDLRYTNDQASEWNASSKETN